MSHFLGFSFSLLHIADTLKSKGIDKKIMIQYVFLYLLGVNVTTDQYSDKTIQFDK